MMIPNTTKNSGRISHQTHFKRLGRELAMQFLYERDMASASGDHDETLARQLFWEQAENAAISDERVFKKARLYAETLISGILFKEKEIDSIIASFSEKWDIRRMAAVDRNIIRIAIYEMYDLPDIPPLVSIDEAIEISKDYATEKSSIFINGILNGVKDSLPANCKNGERKA